MTVYEYLKNMQDCFIRTAIKASDSDMKKLWINRAYEIKERILEMTVAEGSMVIAR